MILRPRQKEAVENSLAALQQYGNSLLVAATGAGKTIILSDVVGKRINGDGRALVVAHREEIEKQNASKFLKIYPGYPISFYDSTKKSWQGRVTFSMIQTLAKPEALSGMPRIDICVYDEAHRAAAPSYHALTNALKASNPNVQIYGVTATPERCDKKALKSAFDNICDYIPISECIKHGYLVPPKAFTVNIGTQDKLKGVMARAGDFEQAEVEAIQNTNINNEQIIDKWKEQAGDRQTAVFCATIKHAEDVRDAFREHGITCETINGKIGKKERRSIIAAFDRKDIQVVTNPMVLTEGWDSPICACVVLLRLSSYKSALIQMVGRGLRKIDPRQHPNETKKDCIVLDFGISLLTHQNLETTLTLGYSDKIKGEIKKKKCPQCGCEMPIQVKQCPFCLYEFKIDLTLDGYHNEAEEISLIEIDLINKSPFRWVDLFGNGRVMISTGFEAWACVASPNGEDWYSVGGKDKKSLFLGVSNKIGAISSADDHMRQNENSGNAKKASRWMSEPASDKQMMMLNKFGVYDPTIVYSKIEAAAFLTFAFNRKPIERILGV